MKPLVRKFAVYFGLADPPPEDEPFATGETPGEVAVRMLPPLLGAFALGEAIGLDRSVVGLLALLGLVVALTALWVFTFNAARGYFAERRAQP